CESHYSLPFPYTTLFRSLWLSQLHCPGTQLHETFSTASLFFNSSVFSIFSISLKLNVAFEIKSTIVLPTCLLHIFSKISSRVLLINSFSFTLAELIYFFPFDSVWSIPFLTILPIKVLIVAGFQSFFCCRTSIISLLVTLFFAQTTRITSHSESVILISISVFIISLLSSFTNVID